MRMRNYKRIENSDYQWKHNTIYSIEYATVQKDYMKNDLNRQNFATQHFLENWHIKTFKRVKK